MRSFWTTFLLSGALICLAAPIWEITNRRYEIQVHSEPGVQYQDISIGEALDDPVYLFARGKRQKNKPPPLLVINAGAGAAAYSSRPKTPTPPASPRLGHQSQPSSPNPALGGIHHTPAQAHQPPAQAPQPPNRRGIVHKWKHDGKTYRLTKGDPRRRVGYEHIMDEHGRDFKALGWTHKNLGRVMEKAMTTGTVVAHQNIEKYGMERARPIYRFEHGGQERYLAISTSANGQVIGANMSDRRQAERHIARNQAWHAQQGQHNGGSGSASARPS